MGFEMHVSVLASAALAAAWVQGSAAGAEEGKGPPNSSLPRWVWRVVMALSDWKQVLSPVLALMAAASVKGALWSAFTLGLSPDEDPWLAGEELGALRRWALLLALGIWRADKFETLLQRMQRSATVCSSVGAGAAIKSGFVDPAGWVWPAVWGIGRRLALVAISSFGCTPFLRTVFPATIMDEFLWWALAGFQNRLSKRGVEFPKVVDVILIPLLDTLHLLPVLTRVALLALYEYPQLDALGSRQAALCVSALAWSGHNAHTMYSVLFADLPETASQLWTAPAHS